METRFRFIISNYLDEHLIDTLIILFKSWILEKVALYIKWCTFYKFFILFFPLNPPHFYSMWYSSKIEDIASLSTIILSYPSYFLSIHNLWHYFFRFLSIITTYSSCTSLKCLKNRPHDWSRSSSCWSPPVKTVWWSRTNKTVRDTDFYMELNKNSVLHSLSNI